MDSQSTTAGECHEPTADRPLVGKAIDGPSTGHEDRWNRNTADSQIRKIVLTIRPLPMPDADVRFPNVEYTVARLRERKNLHDFHR